jgi:hypothetical protein
MEERRKSDRFDLQARTRIVVESQGGEKDVFSVVTKDVSLTGAFVLSPEPLAEGVTVRLEMLMPLQTLHGIIGGEPVADQSEKVQVTVSGKVVRSDDNGMAIKFESEYRIDPAP